jgi:hypothetical protein
LVVQKLVDRVGDLDGRTLEWQYREKAHAYFGKLLRKLEVVSPVALEDQLEEKLTDEEFDDLMELDILLSGIPRRVPGHGQVWLAVEVSSVVDKNEVRRAEHRALLLRKAGIDAIPVVAGAGITEGAEFEAEAARAVLLQNGRVYFWPESLRRPGA